MTLDVVIDLLRCPHCDTEFTRSLNTVGCRRGHQFDVAKQGYLNLLGAAPSANSDTTAMVAARLRVLSAGHFDPLVAAISNQWGAPDVVVDVGAGPGWYLAELLATTSGRGLATDVSTAAVRRAAKAHHRIGAVVWDTWRKWPVASAVADAVLCVFAPRNGAEAARVLRLGGVLVTATPGPQHLQELRAEYSLLGVAGDKAARLDAQLGGHFVCTRQQQVHYQRLLSAVDASDLIAMGPNAFHHAPKVCQPIPVTFDVLVSSWSR